jgi:hypothetical protein
VQNLDSEPQSFGNNSAQKNLNFTKSRPHRFVDRTRLRYGRLKVICLDGIKNHQTIWKCKCDCGKLCQVKGMNLGSGATGSCGCRKREVLGGKILLKHGDSAGGVITTEYRTWSNMKNRCSNPKCEMFYRYGGRGIRVCSRWIHSFENFLADMGRKPKPLHSIERKDLNGNYEAENCVWATAKTQGLNTSRNRFIKLDGVRLTISQWCDNLGFCRSAIHSRIRRGWTMRRALLTPSLS